jgi:hypothetical protein
LLVPSSILYIEAVSCRQDNQKGLSKPNVQKENLMKRALLIVAALVLTVVIFGAGFAFAQYQTASAQALPAFYGMGGGWMHGGRGGPGGGYGPMHDYVEKALAEKLNLTEAQVEEQLAAGKTMYQVALDAGIAEAEIPALLESVHQAAFEKAAADGVLTQAQADAMLEQMKARGFGNCPMGGARPQDGSGFRGGRGGMMNGGRWQQPANP